MARVCNKCGKSSISFAVFHGEDMCSDCASKLRAEEVLNRASKTEDAKDFKGWTSKDMTTAFYEAFGRYVKGPNKEDMKTIVRIWLWACHAEHGVSTAISYAFKWAKLDMYTERKRWGL